MKISRQITRVLAQLRQAGTVEIGLKGIEHEDPPLATGSAKMDAGDDVDFRRMVCCGGLVELQTSS